MLRQIYDFEINKTPIDELARKRELPPAPIPDPDTEVDSITVEFQIVRLSILEIPP
jgi:hypothetical protein